MNFKVIGKFFCLIATKQHLPDVRHSCHWLFVFFHCSVVDSLRSYYSPFNEQLFAFHRLERLEVFDFNCLSEQIELMDPGYCCWFLMFLCSYLNYLNGHYDSYLTASTDQNLWLGYSSLSALARFLLLRSSLLKITHQGRLRLGDFLDLKSDSMRTKWGCFVLNEDRWGDAMIRWGYYFHGSRSAGPVYCWHGLSPALFCSQPKPCSLRFLAPRASALWWLLSLRGNPCGMALYLTYIN